MTRSKVYISHNKLYIYIKKCTKRCNKTYTFLYNLVLRSVHFHNCEIATSWQGEFLKISNPSESTYNCTILLIVGEEVLYTHKFILAARRTSLFLLN